MGFGLPLTGSPPEILLFLRAPSWDPSDRERLMYLEESVAKLDRLGNVEARQYVDLYFELARLYGKYGDTEKSRRALETGLRLDAWRFREQLQLAWLYVEAGELLQAREKANFVLSLSTDDDLRGEGTKLLESIPSPREGEPGGERVTLWQKTLYLLPVGEPDNTILQAIRSRTAEEFGIGVQVLEPRALDFMPDRNPRGDFIAACYRSLRHNISEADVQKLRETSGIREKDLETNRGKLRLLRQFFAGDPGEIQKLEFTVEALPETQFDVQAVASVLIKEQRLILEGDQTLGILAVLKDDIYARNYNFLFGWAGQHFGVMSYKRFLTPTASGAISREIILKRAVMQAFSSTGMILGIGRCTTPNCARAYPHSLEEHDRKEDRICSQCRAALNERLEAFRRRDRSEEA
jgi:predicted Zn-dependent protease